MNKSEFTNSLSTKLSILPKNEIEKSMSYYLESIDDRIEDGIDEEEAVAQLGDINEIAQSIMYDMSIPTLMKAKVNESKNKASNKGLWITLAIVGFPVWLPLLIAFFCVFIALYVSVWAIVLAMYIVVVAFAASGVVSIIYSLILCFTKSMPLGLCIIGMGFACSAIAMFLANPIYLLSKEVLKFTKFILNKTKSFFIAK